MGNVIETVRSTGSDYWAAYVGGKKIKTDGLKQNTRTDVITHLWPTLVKVSMIKNNGGTKMVKSEIKFLR